MKNPLRIGDRVGYSASHLRNTGQRTGRAPFKRGTITAFEELQPGFTLAVVAWEADGVGRVNVAALARVGSLAWAGV